LSSLQQLILLWYLTILQNRKIFTATYSLKHYIIPTYVTCLNKPGQIDAGSLATTKRYSSLSNNGPVPMWKQFQISLQSTNSYYFFVPMCIVRLSKQYVLSHSSNKQPWLLWAVCYISTNYTWAIWQMQFPKYCL